MRPRLLLLSVLHVGCQTYIDAGEGGSGIGQRQLPIIGGTVDYDDAAVVMVRAQRPGAQSFFVCTGTLVSRHVVLTAAHCVLPSRVGADAVFTVYVGTNYRNPDAVLTVKETNYDTAFSEDHLFSGHDIGVLVLNTASTVPPLPMNRTALTDSQRGAPLRLIGYGRDSPSDDLGASVGIKRQATTQVTDFSSVLIQYDDALHNTCQGDSGGPALLMVGGTEVIAGVTSFGDSACTRGSDTRVDVYASSFVDPIIFANDPPPDMALPQNGFPTGTVGANCRFNLRLRIGNLRSPWKRRLLYRGVRSTPAWRLPQPHPLRRHRPEPLLPARLERLLDLTGIRRRGGRAAARGADGHRGHAPKEADRPSSQKVLGGVPNSDDVARAPRPTRGGRPRSEQRRNTCGISSSAAMRPPAAARESALAVGGRIRDTP